MRAGLFKIFFHVTAYHRRKLFRSKQADATDELLAQTVAYEPAPAPHLRDEKILQTLPKVPPFYCAVLLLADP